MFCLYLALGFAIFGAGVLAVPGWWKLAWIALCLVVVMFLPTVLAKILDPLNARRIRAHCAAVGITNVEVEPFPNHYGVRFRKDDKKHYAKCAVVRGRIEWKGRAPEEFS